MKKFLIASGVAVLAFASLAGAQGYTFNNDLTVGSTGADVVALQTALINAGFDIPAITSGAAAKGYFGAQTQSAVKAYQAAHGIPNTGFFGPLTRAAMNAGGVATVPTTPGVIACPVGFVCTPVGGTPTTGTPTGISTVGVPGTLEVSLRSTPSNGTDVKKGEEKVVAAYELEADDSDMQVSNIALNFNKRLWLYAESITILDGSTVIASKSGLSSSDFTEVTSGSDYRIRFSGFSYVVPANSKRTLSVRVKMLSFTDRTADTISLSKFEVRATDGTGVTVTEDATGGARTFDFDATNTGNIVATINASSPTSRIIQTSTSGSTPDVVLMVFDLKAENRDVTVDEINLDVNLSKPVATVGTVFDDIFIEVDGNRYSADTIASTTEFTDLDVTISKDQKKSFRVVATIADADDFADGMMASTTLLANDTNIVGEDSSYDDAAVSATTIVSADVTFLKTGVSVSNTSVTVSAIGDSTKIVNTEFKFTLTAGDKNAIYVSANPSTFVATSTTASSSSLTLIAANLASIPGDSPGNYYIIPAGASREFVLTGSMDNTNGTSGAKEFKITKIYFDDDTSGLQEFNIDFGLEGLRATRTLTN